MKSRAIRETDWGRTMYLVAITGWGQAEDKARASAAGFDQHLTKPVDPERVEELLRDVPKSHATA
jgi:CheY-like chemotaxis protein